MVHYPPHLFQSRSPITFFQEVTLLYGLICFRPLSSKRSSQMYSPTVGYGVPSNCTALNWPYNYCISTYSLFNSRLFKHIPITHLPWIKLNSATRCEFNVVSSSKQVPHNGRKLKCAKKTVKKKKKTWKHWVKYGCSRCGKRQPIPGRNRLFCKRAGGRSAGWLIGWYLTYNGRENEEWPSLRGQDPRSLFWLLQNYCEKVATKKWRELATIGRESKEAGGIDRDRDIKIVPHCYYTVAIWRHRLCWLLLLQFDDDSDEMILDLSQHPNQENPYGDSTCLRRDKRNRFGKFSPSGVSSVFFTSYRFYFTCGNT